MTSIIEKHFYGRRRNRGLHLQRRTAFDIVEQRYCVTMPEAPRPFDPVLFFDGMTPDEVWLEIGFGYGEHLTHQAALRRNVGILGIEPFINGIAVAAMAMVENNIENIRIYPDDAMHIIPHLVPGSLSRIFLFFPDPWPKTRHHKRRFIQPETVALFAQLLKPGGTLHLATDIPELAEWMTEHVTASDSFAWTNNREADRTTPPEHWVTTKYQSKANDAGRSSTYMDFVRR